MVLLFFFQVVFRVCQVCCKLFFCLSKRGIKQFIFLSNCMIVKISSFVVLHFRCQCFLVYIFFEKFFYLIEDDLKIFIKLAIRRCFWPRIG